MPDPRIEDRPINLDRDDRPEGVLLRLPAGATFLDAAPAARGDERYMIDTWWQGHPDFPDVPVVVHVVGTGQTVPSGASTYLATVPMRDGRVWHLYREDTVRVYDLRGPRERRAAPVQAAPWFDPTTMQVRAVTDLRGYSFGLADAIVGAVNPDSEAIALASRYLPDGVTAADLVREV